MTWVKEVSSFQKEASTELERKASNLIKKKKNPLNRMHCLTKWPWSNFKTSGTLILGCKCRRLSIATPRLVQDDCDNFFSCSGCLKWEGGICDDEDGSESVRVGRGRVQAGFSDLWQKDKVHKIVVTPATMCLLETVVLIKRQEAKL